MSPLHALIRASHAFRAIRVPRRLAAAIAAATASVGVLSAVLLAFHTAGPAVWLAPTPDVLEAAASCDRQPERQAREQCRQQLVAARLAPAQQTLQLARR